MDLYNTYGNRSYDLNVWIDGVINKRVLCLLDSVRLG